MTLPSSEVWCIVLAAGRGTRFGGVKQFETAGGRRLVDHVVQIAKSTCGAVVVVLPSGYRWDGEPVAAAVTGGSSRSASVRAGLAAVPPEADIVVVHDAAHPLASKALFQAVIRAVRKGADAAMPGLALTESLKKVVDGKVVGHVARSGIVSAQTPHAFKAAVLRSGHELGIDVSEDTVLVGTLGGTIAVVPGEPRNIHVTTHDELHLVERLTGR